MSPYGFVGEAFDLGTELWSLSLPSFSIDFFNNKIISFLFNPLKPLLFLDDLEDELFGSFEIFEICFFLEEEVFELVEVVVWIPGIGYPGK